jgi:hypothetical protein
VTQTLSTAAGLGPDAIKCYSPADFGYGDVNLGGYEDNLLGVDESVIDCPAAAKAISKLASATNDESLLRCYDSPATRGYSRLEIAAAAYDFPLGDFMYKEVRYGMHPDEE